ncbi:MAG: hypothetical protein HY897_20695 [Deltaproteobacteria bacterium]|nr:hypothetical protein [Deltaproteobacteria bacterium]
MKRTLAWFAAAVVTAQSFAAQAAPAGVPTLDEVRQAIAKKGARWTAADTRFSKMTPEERRRYIGGLIIPPGFRPYSSNLAAALPAPLPSKFDWRSNNGNYVTSVKNQAYCGGCWAFASVGALESRYLIDTSSPGARVDFSEQILISCDSGNYGCDGGMLDEAASFLQNQGTYTEACFEFQGSDSSCSYACSEWSSGQGFFKIGGWIGVSQDVDEIKTAVHTYGPIPVGMIVCGDMEYYDGGVYSHTSGSCPSDAGHAVLVVGWNDTDGAFIVKNSFDTWWGESGHFRIAYNEVYGDSVFGNMAVAYTSAFGTDDTVRVTVATQPTGLELTIDGETFAAPKTFSWFPGSEHQVALQGQKSADGKTMFNFEKRSDGKGAFDALVAPSADGTVTFYFITQYQLMTAVNDQKMGTMKPVCWNGCWIDKGESVTLSATPAQGYVFANWTGDVSASDNPHQFAMGKPMSVKANFKVSQGKNFAITAGTGSSGLIEPSGQVWVAEHASQSFTITPDTGFRISAVEVDGVSAGTPAAYTFKDVTANHTIYATFVSNAQPTFTITATAGAGGAISPSGSVKVAKGASQKFVATPKTGYAVDDIVVDGASKGSAASYTFTNVTADHTIEARFAVKGSQTDGGADDGGDTPGNEAIVSLTFTGDGDGTVTSDPAGLSCTKTCGHAFPLGTDLELTARPAAGSAFGGWHWGHCGRGTICSLTVDTGKNIIVEFKKTAGENEEEDPTEPDPDPSAETPAGDTPASGGCACSTLSL